MIEVRHGKPALVLAPMEGVADFPMRAFLSERGGFSYGVSEFVRISQDPPPLRIFVRDVPELALGSRTPSGLPIQVQLLGGDPEKLAEGAATAIRAGAPAIDLNFGCPAPTVNRHDGGATLLKYPDRIRALVKAVRAAVPREIPVSAKLRLGWDDPQAIYRNAEMAVEGGASWITVHGRTKVQGYKPPAYWGPIGELRRSLGVPVVANGEIWTLDDFRRCRDETGCEHFMIGRGALADPALPGRIARELGIHSGDAEETDSWQAWISRFAEISNSFTDRPGYVSCRIKQWARFIHQRTPVEWYERIKPMQSASDIIAAVSG